MMMRRLTLTLACILAASSPIAAADRTYLCVGDLATGFIWKDGAWKVTTFHVREDRFAVKISGLDVEVTKIGDSYPSHQCSLYSEDATQAACGGLGYGFVLNFETLRYQDYYGLGYVDGGDSLSNTPSLTIGKCSPL